MTIALILAARSPIIAGDGNDNSQGHGQGAGSEKEKDKDKDKNNNGKNDECEEFDVIPFEDVRMIIEFNSSAEDIGVQFFIDAEEWQNVKVFDPEGEQIFSATAKGAVAAQGGGSELFLESDEPGLTDLSLDEFFDRFPEGTYKFVGRAPDCVKLVGTFKFTHRVPKGPEVVSPVGEGDEECAQDVSIPAVIKWKQVDESIANKPIDIRGYEVIVEDDERTFDVLLPADATQVTVPAEFLVAGTEYNFEVLAIEEGRNQTITEGCFETEE
jgi:hypothetical protein